MQMHVHSCLHTVQREIFVGAKFRKNGSRLCRRNFHEQICGALTTSLPVDGHAPHVNQWNDTEQWSEEASLCNNSLVFLLCGGLRNYESIKTAAIGENLACWIEGFSTGNLDFNNFGTPLTGSLAYGMVAGSCVSSGWASTPACTSIFIMWKFPHIHKV